MELGNELASYDSSQESDSALGLAVKTEALVDLLIMLAAYAPHIAEQILEQLGYDTANLTFPVVDTTALVQDSITMVVQVNGKVRGKMEVAPGTSADEIKAQAKAIESVQKFLVGEIKKEIVVPNKLVNIVVAG
jgi:leucyl-tRNA synthetase